MRIPGSKFDIFLARILPKVIFFDPNKTEIIYYVHDLLLSDCVAFSMQIEHWL